MKKALKFLKKNIKKSMTFPEMVDVFEEMSKMPIDTDDDTLLWESSFVDPMFSGKIVHLFSLVRQFPDKKDEYYQIHLDITLETQEKNLFYADPVWSDAIDGDFFDTVRMSELYLQASREKILKVEVNLDQT